MFCLNDTMRYHLCPSRRNMRNGINSLIGVVKEQMAHLGMKGLKEATVVVWHKRTMELLRPLYDLLVSEVFHSDYVQSDESTVPMIDNEKGQAGDRRKRNTSGQAGQSWKGWWSSSMTKGHGPGR